MINTKATPIQPPAIQPRSPADGGSTDVQDRALAELFRRHGGAVYSLACELCGPAVAEEVTEEVFLALRETAGIGPRDAPALMAQAHARIVERLRGARRHGTPVVSSGQELERVLHRSADPAHADLLPGLVPIERQAIALAYFAGRTYHEVAAVLHLSEAGARSTIRAGLGHLHDRLVAAGLVPARLGDPGADRDAAFDLGARFIELAAPWLVGGVEAVIARVIDIAMVTVEGCDLADVLLVDLDTVEPTADAGWVVAGCAALQHQLGEGPGLDAVGGHRIVYAADLSADDLWPRFGPAAAARGIRSVLALPLVGVGADGVLQLCSQSPRAFGVTQRARGVLLASVLGLALATRRGGQGPLAEGSRTASRAREAIIHAQAIMMERERISAAQAFDVVDRAASELDVQLREINREAAVSDASREAPAPPSSR